MFYDVLRVLVRCCSFGVLCVCFVILGLLCLVGCFRFFPWEVDTGDTTCLKRAADESDEAYVIDWGFVTWTCSMYIMQHTITRVSSQP